MDEKSKLRKYAELFEAEENIASMEKVRRECIESWNRDIRAARKIRERIKNEIRTGQIQPELFEMVKNEPRRN